MYILISSIISVFLVYLSKFKNTRFCLEIAIVILILFWGFRYDFGNDYLVYLTNFDSISRGSSNHLDFEYGWMILNELFSNLGFSYLVFFVTIVQFYSIYFYLKHYVDRKYRWFVLIFYIINVSLMIHSLSGMRQTIAMSLFVFGLHYIYNKNYLISFVILFLAAQFHSSAYFMLILPLTTYLVNINKKILGGVLLIIFLACFIIKDSILNLSTMILQFESVAKYEDYLEQSDEIYSGSGLGIILQMFVLLILVLNNRKDNNMHNWLERLYEISFIFVPLYTILPIFNRMQMYFLLLGMGGTPILLKVYKRNPIYCAIITLYLLMLLLAFKSAITSGPYSVYKTIFN